MAYKLRTGQESFRVVDGLFSGRIYRVGVAYNEIPKEEASRFEEIAPEPVPMKMKKAAKADEVTE